MVRALREIVHRRLSERASDRGCSTPRSCTNRSQNTTAPAGRDHGHAPGQRACPRRRRPRRSAARAPTSVADERRQRRRSRRAMASKAERPPAAAPSRRHPALGFARGGRSGGAPRAAAQHDERRPSPPAGRPRISGRPCAPTSSDEAAVRDLPRRPVIGAGQAEQDQAADDVLVHPAAAPRPDVATSLRSGRPHFAAPVSFRKVSAVSAKSLMNFAYSACGMKSGTRLSAP